MWRIKSRASDRTSKSAGDIEIFKNDKLFEAIEIKLDKPIDSNILRITKEKIVKYNPKRYYVLSYNGILEEDKAIINQIIQEVKEKHGCEPHPPKSKIMGGASLT